MTVAEALQATVTSVRDFASYVQAPGATVERRRRPRCSGGGKTYTGKRVITGKTARLEIKGTCPECGALRKLVIERTPRSTYYKMPYHGYTP